MLNKNLKNCYNFFILNLSINFKIFNNLYIFINFYFHKTLIKEKQDTKNQNIYPTWIPSYTRRLFFATWTRTRHLPACV